MLTKGVKGKVLKKGDKGALKLLEYAARQYEEADAMSLDSMLNPEHKEQNDVRIAELNRSASSIAKMFGL